jgi:hypothetical protein
MQDVDRVAYVETLSKPARRGGMSVQDEALCIVQRAQELDRLIRYVRRGWDVRENPPVRATELKLAVRQSLELEALFMHGAVMTPAQQREIRERGGPAVGPVTDVVAFADPDNAARETTAAVSVV